MAQTHSVVDWFDYGLVNLDDIMNIGAKGTFKPIPNHNPDNGNGNGNGNTNTEGALFCETFDECNGTGGNDDSWSGNIAKGDFNPDNDGWTAGGDKAYGAHHAHRLGKLLGVAAVVAHRHSLHGTHRQAQVGAVAEELHR